jgi:hypothetical protein
MNDWIETHFKFDGQPWIKAEIAKSVALWNTKREAREATKDRAPAYMLKRVYVGTFKSYGFGVVDDYGRILSKHGATRPLRYL